jgi:oligopeptide/dipeptide ABC transporter ATP-binding protein
MMFVARTIPRFRKFRQGISQRVGTRWSIALLVIQGSSAAMSSAALLEVRNLVKEFPAGRSLLRRGGASIRAVDGISFSIARGETLALVGESGCGKTTTGRLVMRLIEPSSGEVRFSGTDVLAASRRELRALRQRMQIVFQDPYRALDPQMTLAQIIGEPLVLHRLASGRELRKRIHDLLERVGLDPVSGERRPHEFSGGQRQRIGIARALASNPELVVCDEPTSALDVSIQAQITNLLRDLQRDFQLAYLYISHDLALVNHISDRVAVMYLGRIVELAPKQQLFTQPRHPYTRALLASIPSISRPRTMVDMLLGGPPSAIAPPSGCHLHPRCPLAEELGNPPQCTGVSPLLREIGIDHVVACHFAR